MNKINRKLEYALMALKLMSGRKRNELASAKEIALHLATPYELTARVMQTLAQGGLVRVEYGPTGGYAIQRELGQVTLHELINLIEGPTQIAKCMHREEGCEISNSCNIQNPMSRLNKKMNDFYKSISLQELLDSKNEGEIVKRPEVSHVG